MSRIAALAAAVRFTLAEVPQAALPAGRRYVPAPPVPVMHGPVLDTTKAARCVICGSRPGNWRHGHAGRQLERLRRRGGLAVRRPR